MQIPIEIPLENQDFTDTPKLVVSKTSLYLKICKNCRKFLSNIGECN